MSISERSVPRGVGAGGEDVTRGRVSRAPRRGLEEENATLTERLAALRGALERLTSETASLRRSLRLARAENRDLRAPLEQCQRRETSGNGVPVRVAETDQKVTS